MKKIIIKIWEGLKKIWKSPIIKTIVKGIAMITLAIIAVLFAITKLSNLFSKNNKKNYNNKINKAEDRRIKDEKIINGLKYSDTNDDGTIKSRKK